jgi:hypothetical protein
MRRAVPFVKGQVPCHRAKGSKYPHGATYIRIARNKRNARKICERIVQGMTLKQIAVEMGAAHHSTILMWVAQDPDFAEQYRLAKQAQADHFAEEIIEIADDGSNDWMEREKANGETYQLVDYEAVNRSKLRVETRLKLMRAYAPRRFGDKVEVEHSVSDSFADRLVKARERRMLVIDNDELTAAE